MLGSGLSENPDSVKENIVDGNSVSLQADVLSSVLKIDFRNFS